MFVTIDVICKCNKVVDEFPHQYLRERTVNLVQRVISFFRYNIVRKFQVIMQLEVLITISLQIRHAFKFRSNDLMCIHYCKKSS